MQNWKELLSRKLGNGQSAYTDGGRPFRWPSALASTLKRLFDGVLLDQGFIASIPSDGGWESPGLLSSQGRFFGGVEVLFT